MQLRNVNLNLLPILRALLVHRNVTRAAEAVGVTQSTVSKALAQLRASLRDPLLIREGSGYILSGMAEGLLHKVDHACQSAEAVFKAGPFDPSGCKRTFHLSMPDYGALIILPAIREILEREAPGIALRFTESSLDSSFKDFETDFFLLPSEWVKFERVAHLHRYVLIQEELVYVKRRDREPTSEVVFSYRALNDAAYPMIWRGPDVQPALPVRVYVEQTSLLPILSALFDATALAPRTVVEMLMPLLPIEIDHRHKPPIPNLELCLCWHARFDADLEHRWFREVLRRIFPVGNESGKK